MALMQAWYISPEEYEKELEKRFGNASAMVTATSTPTLEPTLLASNIENCDGSHYFYSDKFMDWDLFSGWMSSMELVNPVLIRILEKTAKTIAYLAYPIPTKEPARLMDGLLQLKVFMVPAVLDTPLTIIHHLLWVLLRQFPALNL